MNIFQKYEIWLENKLVKGIREKESGGGGIIKILKLGIMTSYLKDYNGSQFELRLVCYICSAVQFMNRIFRLVIRLRVTW